MDSCQLCKPELILEHDVHSPKLKSPGYALHRLDLPFSVQLLKSILASALAFWPNVLCWLNRCAFSIRINSAAFVLTLIHLLCAKFRFKCICLGSRRHLCLREIDRIKNSFLKTVLWGKVLKNHITYFFGFKVLIPFYGAKLEARIK